MSRFIQPLPIWDNAGSKPTDAAIAAGWQVKDRPPAAWFNWNWNSTYECIKEIRELLDEDATTKQNVPLQTATLAGSTYTVTSVQPATALSDGMTINIRVVGDSVDSATLNLDGLGAKNLVYDGTTNVGLKTLLDNRIYTIVYRTSTDKWHILNIVNKLEFPPLYSGTMDQLLYDGQFVAASPFSDGRIAPGDFALVTSTTLKYSTFNYVRQVVQAAMQGTSWSRIINKSNAAVIRDWTEIHNIQYMTRNVDVFKDMSGSGLAGGIVGTQLTISPGCVYSAGWFYEKIAAQTLDLSGFADGTINIAIAIGGSTSAYTTTKPANYGPQIATVVKTGTSLSAYTRLVTAQKLKALMQMDTPDSSTNSDVLATTKFVQGLIGSVASGTRVFNDAGTTARTATVSGFTNIGTMLDIPIGLIANVAFGTSAMTLNLNGYGAKPLMFVNPATGAYQSTPPYNNAIAAGGIYWVVWDGTNFVVERYDTKTGSTNSPGILQLYAGVDSTSNLLAATPGAVKQAYDLATSANAGLANYIPLTQRGAANGVATLDASSKVPTTQLPGATTSAPGIVQLSSSTSSTSTTQAATAAAVKAAYDTAVSAGGSADSKAPINHASADETYGRATPALFGHAMESSATPLMDGTANAGVDNGKFAREGHVHPVDTSRAPTNHASTGTTYGAGNASNYGHVLLNDDIDSNLAASASVGASPLAVKNAKEFSLKASGTTTGSDTAYSLAASGFTLTDGATVRVKLHVVSGASPTLNVNGTGAKSLMYPSGKNMKAGIAAGTWITATYSTTLGFFILLAEGGDSGGARSGSGVGQVSTLEWFVRGRCNPFFGR